MTFGLLRPARRFTAMALVATACFVSACADRSTPVEPVDDRTLQVLLFTHTAGFRHPSIEDAKAFFAALPATEKIVATATEDPTIFTDDGLEPFDVLVFANTTGDILDSEQQAALQRFVRSGRGWVGVHSAADTEHDWPWYGQLVGAYFISHPLLPVTVDVTTENPSHPSTAHLPAKFSFTDEIYNFDRNPRRDHDILLTIDEKGFIFPNFPATPSMGADHPVAWTAEFEGGRVFYTNLGHRPETWADPLFQRHLLEGIRWAAQPVEWNRISLTSKAANPMALAVAPDGRVFFTERTGELRSWDPASGRTIDSLVLPVDTTAENGLLGVVLDPEYARNRYIYLYHSEPGPNPPPEVGPRGDNVLSRFTVGRDGVVDVASRHDVLRVPSDRQCCHEGGSLAFGPDGSLFLGTGDNTNPFAASGLAPLDEQPGRERFNSQRTAGNPFDPRGKVLRIRPDGSIPPGNLYPESGEAGRPEVYAIGTRNPFRIAVDPQTGRLYWGDVGPDAASDAAAGPRGYDEINVADSPGDYGWPFCIGFNRPYADLDYATGAIGPPFSCAGRRAPTIAYDYLNTDYLALGSALDPEASPGVGGIRFSGRTAIAGTVYRRPRGEARFALPEQLEGALLMTDWTRDIIAAAHVDESGGLVSLDRIVPFFQFRRPIDVEVGPDGALYVLEYGSGYYGDNVDAGLSRIEYTAAGRLTPVAAAHASVDAGAAPLAVSFSAEGSRVPGRRASIQGYEWDFDGDGEVDSRDAAPSFTFERPGVYQASLVVVASGGRRSYPSVQEIVVGNTPPDVEILDPADGTSVAVGDKVVLHGRASDAEDGTAACQDLVWDIRLGHNAHSHPTVTMRGCEVTFNVNLGGHDEQGQLFFVVELSYKDRGGPGGEPALVGRQGIKLLVD